MCMRHMGLGQIGDGRKGGQIAHLAVQRFHNRGNAAERDHDGAHVGSLVEQVCSHNKKRQKNNCNIMIGGSHIMFFKSVSLC